MTEYVSLALREGWPRRAAVLLYAPGADPYFEELVKECRPGVLTSTEAES